jgi:hypothetical protein
VSHPGDEQYGPPPGYVTAPGPGYGPPPQSGPPPWGWQPAPTTWPHGPDRPRSATVAAVLGFVTGGLSALVSLLFLLMAVIGGQDDPVSMLLILGLPCGAGLIFGAARLLSGDLPGPLFGWAIAAVGVLVVAALMALVAFDAADLLAVAVFVVLALPLPVLTAVFAWRPDTRDWASEAR